jgi:DNA polymerase-3 subunit beta
LLNLGQTLDRINGSVPRRSTIPILGHVLIEAKDKLLSVRGTNLDREVTVHIIADVTTPGIMAVPCDVLRGLVKRLDKDDNDVELCGDPDRLTIKSGRSHYQLSTEPVEDFPKPIEVHAEACCFEIDAKRLAELFGSVHYAACKEETRWYLVGVHMRIDDGRLTFVANDGHRLAVHEIEAPQGSKGMPSVIIPSDTVRELQAMLNHVVGAVSIHVSETAVHFQAGALGLGSRLIDGDYPDYERVIPKTDAPTVTVSPEQLADACERALLVYTGIDEKQPWVKLVVGNDGLSILASVHKTGHSGTEIIDAMGESKVGAAVSVNPRYLIDVCKVMGESIVDIQMNGAGSAILVTSENKPQMRHIMMSQNRAAEQRVRELSHAEDVAIYE